MVGVYWPVRYRGRPDEVRGRLCAVLWENLADPIISGREEIGQPKLYAEITDPVPDTDIGAATVTASWDGYRFLELGVQDLTEAPATLNESRPVLYLKYIPRTGDWGAPDACYATLTPAGSARGTVVRGLAGPRKHRFPSSDLRAAPHVVPRRECPGRPGATGDHGRWSSRDSRRG